jgi:uncharacterized membrane protein
MENNTHGPIEALVEKAEAFGKTSLELYRLKAIDKSSGIISSLASNIVLTAVGLVFIAVLNIGLSLWIGELLGKFYYGFFIVAAFYALAGVILFLFRNRWIKNPVSNAIIRNALN